MAETFVVIDLETTGLDTDKDKIIEVAAVKIKRNLIVDEFASLIEIDCPLTPEISALTGISDDMLVGQPRIEDIIPSLSEFIGDATLIAHNADFDRTFLQRYWPDSRAWIDTVTLSQIAYPLQPSHSLAWLTNALGIENTNAHRALADALATAELFLRISKDIAAFPDYLQEDLLHLAESDHSPLADFIRSRCNKRKGGEISTPSLPKAPPAAKRTIDENYVLDIAELGKYLGEKAIYKERYADFEERPQQLLFSQEVAKAFNNNSFLLAEAGTGTGKSLAYLLPAVLFAKGSGRQVAIATYTRNLQEQLLNKDVVMLSRLLDMPVKAAVLKGRSNYLCKRLYKYFCQEPSDDIRYFLMQIAVWKGLDNNAEQGELPLNSYTRRKWQRLCGAKENCAPFCPFRQKNSCYVQKARFKAAEADVLILNHSLLIANAANNAGFLPELPYLIIDEAQHLENATEDQLTTAVSFFDILNMLGRYSRKEKGRETGVIATMAKLREGLYDNFDYEQVQVLVEKLAANVEDTLVCAEKFYQVLDSIFAAEKMQAIFFPTKVRVMPAHRNDYAWQLLEQMTDELSAALKMLAGNSLQILDTIKASKMEEEDNTLPRGFDELYSLGTMARELADTIRACISEENSNYVAWVEYGDKEAKPSVSIAPIEIDEILQQLLYEKTEAIVMTSATLSLGKDFSYFKDRTGLSLLPDPPRELTLSSPFFYRDQALFTIVDDLPDWSKCSEIEATAAISAALIKLLSVTRGRAIVLFTSHLQLKNIYREISGPLKQEGITVLAHGVSGAPSMLLERLKKEDNCCILGAASFWEGVDVIGEALSAVIVVRLPFWPPNTPLATTRMERIEADGKSAFWDYSMPMALIRFKQGFGRLIRSDKDSGVFCVLDKRIIEKRYGSSFIKVLPDLKRIHGDTDSIAEQIKKWL